MFINALKTELYKTTHNYFYVFSEICLLLLAFLHVITDSIPISNSILSGEYPETVFNHWIGLNFSSIFSVGFFFIAVAIASLPMGLLYVQEKRTSYIYQLISKIGKKNTLIIKFISYYISGGIAVVIPLLIDYFVTSAVLPSVKPISATFYYSISGNSFLASVFYTHPTAYVLIRILIIGLFAGMFTVSVFIAEMVIANAYLVCLFPFVIFIGMHIVFSYLGKGGYSPYNIINPVNGEEVTLMSMVLVFVVILIVIYTATILEVNKDEL